VVFTRLKTTVCSVSNNCCLCNISLQALCRRVEDRHSFACKVNAPPVPRVLVVEDSPQVRQAICALLEKSEQVEIVGEASNGREGVDT
jgi:hypothetical protein